MGKKNTQKAKWNRVHYFQRKKSGNRVGHPVYVYGTRGNQRKYLVFTHNPPEGQEDNFELLKHNIDPEEEQNNPARRSWVKKSYEVSRYDGLREPDKAYRIHDDDRETVKKYRK